MTPDEIKALKRQARLDQLDQNNYHDLAISWRNLFESLVLSGFTEAQALELVRSYAASLTSATVAVSYARKLQSEG